VKPVVVLYTGPLGQLANHRITNFNRAIRTWVKALQANHRRIVIPEVADFEVRRELIRIRSQRSLRTLESLGAIHEYRPVTTDDFRRAAQLWADARNAGIPTAHHHALDCDVLLVAQAESLGAPFVIATSNVAHIGRFAPAEVWSNIPV
jgi:predicted nucleic acid-binding protein